MTTLLSDYKRKKKFVYGGSWDGVNDPYGDEPEGFSSSMQDGAGELTYRTANSGDTLTGEQGTTGGNSTAMGASIVDAGVQLGSAAIIAQTNKQKNQKTGWTPDGHYRTKSGAQGIATGWSIGNKIYPGIGGIVGAFAGGIYGAFRGNKQDKEAKKDWEGNNALFRQKEQLAMQGQAYNQWSKQQGNPQTQMYRNGGKMRESKSSDERTLVKTAVNFIPGYEQYLDYKDITLGAATGDIPRMNQGVVGLGMPLSGKALSSTLDYVTEKTLGKKTADANESKRTNILNRSTGDLQLMVKKYGFGAYDKWVADGSPNLYEEEKLKEQQENYEILKNIKPAAKYPIVPSSSTTAVRKPLVQRANGGSLRKDYQAWRSKLPKNLQYEGDYDLEGFYNKYPDWTPENKEVHMNDEFKLPNHPTFSNESKYYNGVTPGLGGSWKGEGNDAEFVPNPKVGPPVAPVKRANGGSLRKTSSNSTEVHGPSHANGGVEVPQANAELEGGETILHEADQDYVFSEELGFAELHKKIAKSRGKIEKKPATFERLNSLRAISEKEQMLKQAQETIRSQYNLK